MNDLKDFTVWWEGENGEAYSHDFKNYDMEGADRAVKMMAALYKDKFPLDPKCDMWDAMVELQCHD